MSDNIEIPLSRTKLVLLLIGALLFFFLGIWFIIDAEQFITNRFQYPQIIVIIGVIATIFFGLCLLFILKKLFDSKPGILIDQKGITDYSSATSIGVIEWTDIMEIRTVQIVSTKILILKTDKPDKYIEKAKNRLSKRAMQANYNMYGSPLTITSSALKIAHRDLEELILREFEKRKLQL